MRPQWLVRPPSIRPRHQSNWVPGAFVYGSPSICQPPSQASNSPNGRRWVERPRRGEAYAGTIIWLSFDAYHACPASSITTRAPACVSAYAAIPPPAPDPTMHTSYGASLLLICNVSLGLEFTRQTHRRQVCDAVRSPVQSRSRFHPERSEGSARPSSTAAVHG